MERDEFLRNLGLDVSQVPLVDGLRYQRCALFEVNITPLQRKLLADPQPIAVFNRDRCPLTRRGIQPQRIDLPRLKDVGHNASLAGLTDKPDRIVTLRYKLITLGMGEDDAEDVPYALLGRVLQRLTLLSFE